MVESKYFGIKESREALDIIMAQIVEMGFSSQPESGVNSYSLSIHPTQFGWSAYLGVIVWLSETKYLATEARISDHGKSNIDNINFFINKHDDVEPFLNHIKTMISKSETI